MLTISFKLNLPLHSIHAKNFRWKKNWVLHKCSKFVLGKVTGIVTIYGFGTEILCILALIKSLEMFLHAVPLLPNLDKPLM